MVHMLCDELSRSGEHQSASLDCQDLRGQTPLHLAAKNGRLAAMAALLHHGARIDVKVGRRNVRT